MLHKYRHPLTCIFRSDGFFCAIFPYVLVKRSTLYIQWPINAPLQCTFSHNSPFSSPRVLDFFQNIFQFLILKFEQCQLGDLDTKVFFLYNSSGLCISFIYSLLPSWSSLAMRKHFFSFHEMLLLLKLSFRLTPCMC